MESGARSWVRLILGSSHPVDLWRQAITGERSSQLDLVLER